MEAYRKAGSSEPAHRLIKWEWRMKVGDRVMTKLGEGSIVDFENKFDKHLHRAAVVLDDHKLLVKPAYFFNDEITVLEKQ